MAQQYYTLEEAARLLRTTPDKLKEMAKRNEVRAFQDRGTMRFRAQEIDEKAREQGLGSDPELQFGEAAPPPRPKTSMKEGGKAKPSPKEEDEPIVLDLDLGMGGDEVALGEEKRSDKPGPRSSVLKLGPKSGKPSPKSGLGGGRKSPAPKPAGDSDVRLVLEGSNLDFQIDLDSDVKVPPSGSGGPKSPGRKSRMVRPDAGPDSGVRIVPLDDPSDSDVKVVPQGSSVSLGGPKAKAPSDSDIRLEGLPAGRSKKERASDDALVTEEIDLDAEEAKAAAAAAKAKGKFGGRPSSGPALPTSSPFELSENDLSLEDKAPARSPKKPAKSETDSSSDFELMPFDPSKSPLELGSGEIPLLSEDEVGLGELGGPSGGNSGINLADPIDSGISLEDGASDEFDMSLDLAPVASSGPSSSRGPSTPKPGAPADSDVDSSSEFELTLDDGSGAGEESDTDSGSSEFELTLDAEGESGGELTLGVEKEEGDDPGSSEFELTLDAEGEGDSSITESGSDSEFELTLDAEGELSGGLDEAEGGKDIFEETNIDLPGLDEESGSEAVALDEADSEGSDFDLSLEEEDSSGSQVVTIDEDADDAAATVAKPRKTKTKTKAKPPPSEDEAELDLDLEKEPERDPDEVEEEEPVTTRVAAPAPEWGVLPALVLMPTVLLMFVAALMGFELVQGMWGYNKPNTAGKPVLNTFAKIFADDKEKKLYEE